MPRIFRGFFTDPSAFHPYSFDLFLPVQRHFRAFSKKIFRYLFCSEKYPFFKRFTGKKPSINTRNISPIFLFIPEFSLQVISAFLSAVISIDNVNDLFILMLFYFVSVRPYLKIISSFFEIIRIYLLHSKIRKYTPDFYSIHI